MATWKNGPSTPTSASFFDTIPKGGQAGQSNYHMYRLVAEHRAGQSTKCALKDTDRQGNEDSSNILPGHDYDLGWKKPNVFRRDELNLAVKPPNPDLAALSPSIFS